MQIPHENVEHVNTIEERPRLVLVRPHHSRAVSRQERNWISTEKEQKYFSIPLHETYLPPVLDDEVECKEEETMMDDLDGETSEEEETEDEDESTDSDGYISTTSQ